MSGVLLKVAPWSVGALAIAGVVIWGLWGQLKAAETKLGVANAVIQQREADAKANAIAVAQLAQKLTDTETKVITVTEKIYAAPVTRECAASPSMRAASDGVRALLAPREAGDRAQPAAPVR
ncbi:MAG: hypothetical protein HQ465_20125 [Rhodospirillales bacterium]|nr:hypothetical protein [Rhodospirillales bacterium]